MDQFPGVKGQTLVIPKAEIDYAFDLDSETYAHIFQIAKKIAKASDKAFNTVRTCLVVEGFEVPHVHIKLYPMTEDNKDLSSALKNGGRAEDEELTKLAAKIKSALQP
jgi:histidine triad (HIT) family protein